MNRCAASTSRIASLTETPASITNPIIAMTPMGSPTGTSAIATPMRLNGMALKTVTGCSSDSNVPASTMKTRTSASTAAQRSSDVVSTRSRSSPASSALSPGAKSGGEHGPAGGGGRDAGRDSRRDLRDAALVAAEDLAGAEHLLDLGDVADRYALTAARADR